MHHNFLRKIPSVNELLESPEISEFLGSHPRPIVVEAIRVVLDDLRRLLVGERKQKPGKRNVWTHPPEVITMTKKRRQRHRR